MIVVRWMYPRDMLQYVVVRWLYPLDMVQWCSGYVLGTWYRQCSGEMVYHYEVALWEWLVVRWTPLTVHWYGEGAHLAEYNALVCMFTLCIMKQMIYNPINIVPISLIQALKIFFREKYSGVITCFEDKAKGIFLIALCWVGIYLQRSSSLQLKVAHHPTMTAGNSQYQQSASHNLPW